MSEVASPERIAAPATPKVGFVSLGCPKALTDSELILTQLSAEGYELMAGSPWRGSRGTNAYLRPPAGSGLVLELIEKRA